ncbi:hypothetical protein [Roseofilum acuticapitatum]|uniref:hypothetical protein n=1 Tax=Roseofilum acuticapitatum TaxID=3082945 RepID=UPI003D2F67E3
MKVGLTRQEFIEALVSISLTSEEVESLHERVYPPVTGKVSISLTSEEVERNARQAKTGGKELFPLV